MTIRIPYLLILCQIGLNLLLNYLLTAGQRKRWNRVALFLFPIATILWFFAPLLEPILLSFSNQNVSIGITGSPGSALAIIILLVLFIQLMLNRLPTLS